MNDNVQKADVSSAVAQRSQVLFENRQNENHKLTDRLFAKLMLIQWVAGIGAAIWISPKTWAGAQSQIHVHIWAALLIGGAIASLPVALAWLQPGRATTRHTIAVGQMLTSALLIHLTGGRIETHFHVFGSLAFLAFYRDWKVMVSATVVVAADHFLRGVFWPQSVFGILASSPWRWVEHAGWVVFEDVFLLISIQQSVREMRQNAERQASLEALNQSIEKTHRQLVESSRQAGMAEVATSVLHNVGNVLNSVNVSTSLVAEKIRNSELTHLTAAARLLEETNDLPAFFANDPRGKKLPGFLKRLADHLVKEQQETLKELSALGDNIDHIKEIVSMQQSYSRVSSLRESLPVVDLVEDALRMNALAIERHGVEVAREYSSTPTVTVEKHKVLQILVNLIRNAKHALDDSEHDAKRLTLRVGVSGNNMVKIAIADNGVGILKENLTRIFEHGFTTRKDGHGFGLHSGALAARELGGSLTAQSAGPGSGATFTLEFPCQPMEGNL